MTESNIETERRRACVNGLRQMATFIEEHPELPVPLGVGLNVFVSDKGQLAEVARVGGVKWEKCANGDFFYIKANFEGEHSYEVNISRKEICRRVVTGTRVEPAQPEREVEIVEWVCNDEPLLAGAL